MLFEIKAPGWSFAYAGLFKIEEVAEEICIELEHTYKGEFVRDKIWNEIWNNIYYTLENTKEWEEKTIYDFKIKCIEE